MNWIKRFSILGSVAIASTISSLAIAPSADARFVIFVAGNDFATLQRVRTVSPRAFTTKINSQPVIQAGTFNSEISADSLAIALQQSGLSAQKYFRATGGKERDVQALFTDTTVAPITPLLSTPQSVVIQQTSLPQPAIAQPESQPQIFNSVPQQSIAYTSNQCVQAAPINLQPNCAQPQYQQIVTSTLAPQVQTQQVLVPRWQQVMVPETRQVLVTQTVPQAQILQAGYVQSGCLQSGCIQPTTYQQPQTGFIPQSPTVATLVPSNFDSSGTTSGNFAVSPQVAVANTGLSDDALLPQASQNPNFRYIAAVPAKSNNQFLLSRVRQYVPNAFFSNSGRGTYIHAGAYQSRDSAESVSRYLRSQGVDSRVLYF